MRKALLPRSGLLTPAGSFVNWFSYLRHVLSFFPEIPEIDKLRSLTEHVLKIFDKRFFKYKKVNGFPRPAMRMWTNHSLSIQLENF